MLNAKDALAVAASVAGFAMLALFILKVSKKGDEWLAQNEPETYRRMTTPQQESFGRLLLELGLWLGFFGVVILVALFILAGIVGVLWFGVKQLI